MQKQTGNHFRFSIEEALFLEKKLNDVHYHGIASGGLFADILYMSYYFTSYELSLTLRIREWLQYLNLKHIPKTIETKQATVSLKNRYLFNYTVNSERLTGFFPPLVSLFRKEEIAFASKPGEQHEQWHEYPFFTYPGLTKAQYQSWGKQYRLLEKEFKSVWKAITRTLYIPSEIRTTFMIAAIIQTQRLHFFLEYFEEERPICVLTDHDRQAFNAALVLAANAKKYLPTPLCMAQPIRLIFMYPC